MKIKWQLFILALGWTLLGNSQTLPLGDWYGHLDIMGQQLSIVFHIKKDSIYLDSPDQKAFNIPMDTISISENSLYFKSYSMMASYDGEFRENPDTLIGTFKQGGMDLTLNMSRFKIEKEVRLRPQDPNPPFDYKVKDITFRNKKAKINLAGTLTIPMDCDECPVVVMITGSGPQDRNEELVGHKPFWVIADHLANNGIACLRYDDRGIAESEGNFHEATSFDFAKDAGAAVDYLKKMKTFSKIGLMGHSEGGLIAPMVATDNKNVDFAVLLAGTGVPGKDIVSHQQKLIGSSTNDDPVLLEKHVETMKKLNNIVIQEKDLEVAINKIHSYIDTIYREFNDDEKEYFGPKMQYKMQMSATLGSPWWKNFLVIDPADYLSQLKIPVLALFGDKDLQVDPAQNAGPMEKALSQSTSSYEIKVFKNKNHLFQNTETGRIEEYGKIEETISEDVLEFFTLWINSL